jgi:hypothetical protein
MAVSQDATSGWYLPETGAEWTELLSGTGIGNPESTWLMQEGAGNFADSIGPTTMVASAVAPYAAAVAGWSRLGWGYNTDGGVVDARTTPTTYAGSTLLLAFYKLESLPGAERTLMYSSGYKLNVTAAGYYLIDRLAGGGPATGTISAGTDVRPIILKVDKTSNVAKAYSSLGEILAPTSPFTASTTAAFIGGVVQAGPAFRVLYSALWTGADAEMSDDDIAELLSRLENGVPVTGFDITTRAAFQAGGSPPPLRWVLCIDGYRNIITDGDTAAALAAHAGTDYTGAIDGLVVECRPTQTADPNNPFANKGGSCVVSVKPEQVETSESFGVEVNRRGVGSWTTLSATIDRNDTALAIRSNLGFAAGPEDAHIGCECIEYSGTAASSMTVTTRGKYTAIGCHASGSGGSRFADHHRVALDQNHVQSNPLVSEQPRRWIGRRANLYLHVVDENGALNSKANAELVFPGRIKAIGDETNGYTKMRLEHFLAEFPSVVLGGNQLTATVTEGMYLPTGAVFNLLDRSDWTAAAKNANPLTVVASGAAGTNQINAGDYTIDEICQFLNTWLGAEFVAARIYGRYSWASPVQTSAGVCTVINWIIASGSSTTCNWEMSIPAGVAGFLGMKDIAVGPVGGNVTIGAGGFPANTTQQTRGSAVPYRIAVFSKGGPGGSLPSFRVRLENETGEFVNQYDTLPSIIKAGLDPTKPWGLFLIDEKLLVQASYANNQLDYCFITPFGQTTIGDSQEPFYTMGRRVDEDGPVKVRQVYDIEGSFEQIFNILHYNTGTAGYNHATYDTQAVGLGAAIPGGYLGDAFEQSIANLPRAEALCRLRFDEPTTLANLIGGELLARHAFPVWKNGGLVYQQWQSPVTPKATFSLTEENKFRPSNSSEDMKSATLETAAYARPVAKFDFDADFAFGRAARYRGSLSIHDHVAIDDGSGSADPLTIKLRNTVSEEDVKGLIGAYMAKMTLRSRPSKYLARAMGAEHFFGIAPGDICLLVDRFARDPRTGLRYNASTDTGGLDGRPAVVMHHEFDLGGENVGRGQDEPRQLHGHIEVNFFDQTPGSAYGPSADIDETESSGGFSAGYNNGTLTIRCKAHSYTESTEAVDAAQFEAPFEAIIVEKDPPNPAAPLNWAATIVSRSGNDLVIDAALGGWDPAKQYRVLFNSYSVGTAIQRDNAYQADDVDEMVEDIEVPYRWCATPEEETWSYNTTQPTEFLPDLSFGDGRSLDVGHETALDNAINNLIDHKTAHHAMFMWTELPTAGSGLNQWRSLFFGRIYLGQEMLGNSVYRYMTLAPWFWLDNSAGATSADVRVTISRDMPTHPIGVSSSDDGLSFSEFYSQATWSTSSTTPAMGAEQTLEVRVKDIFWGMAYILVEKRNAFCRGLIKAREGERFLVL